MANLDVASIEEELKTKFYEPQESKYIIVCNFAKRFQMSPENCKIITFGFSENKKILTHEKSIVKFSENNSNIEEKKDVFSFRYIGVMGERPDTSVSVFTFPEYEGFQKKK